ncbi:site-2 protease family protein [Virgibacillus siamensis]|uniref:site-2 protease family protein n=1 Tax=Virgibacillus siamensis TaxID=480071 RepID=UPI0009845534|nr:site-2 protease family protein [Virgibacillus siamensis]
MDVYTLLYLVFVVAPIGTFVHESGHALGASLVKANSIFLTIGTGRRVYEFTLRNIQVIIHLYFFIGGSVSSEREVPFDRFEKIWIAAAGPICNSLLAIMLWYVNSIYPHYSIVLLALFNFWVAGINIIPFQIRGRQSDGCRILMALIQK